MPAVLPRSHFRPKFRNIDARVDRHDSTNRHSWQRHSIASRIFLFGSQQRRQCQCEMASTRDADQLETQNDQRLDELTSKIRTLRGVRLCPLFLRAGLSDRVDNR